MAVPETALEIAASARAAFRLTLIARLLPGNALGIASQAYEARARKPRSLQRDFMQTPSGRSDDGQFTRTRVPFGRRNLQLIESDCCGYTLSRLCGMTQTLMALTLCLVSTTVASQEPARRVSVPPADYFAAPASIDEFIRRAQLIVVGALKH